MNEYDEKYEIRIAEERDIKPIMDFLKNNWKDTHIMANDRKLFEYEFLEEDGTVNFILAIDKEKGTIESLNGVLKASHDNECLDIFGSFWKTIDGNMAFLGLELIKRKQALFGARNTIGVGDNPKTAVPLMKLLKLHTSKMKHYYMLAERADFKIAKIVSRPINNAVFDVSYRVCEYMNIKDVMKHFDAELYKNNIPYKDYWYINHRFFEYPYYKYHVCGIERCGVAIAIIVYRIQEYCGHSAIRIVDYIGDIRAISKTASFWKLLLKDNNVEYVDFYCDGVDEKLIIQAGFTKKEENDENIIPNYFSPFVQSNIDIFVSSTDSRTVFMKADADQDRPN